MHGDFHLDNCLLSVGGPQVLAVVDWEMATIGDPMIDLGLFLSFWGNRPIEPPAMPRVQGVSRLGGAPDRVQLAIRYGELTGRDITHVNWYEAFAFWKLAVVVESAWAQHVLGEINTPYSSALEYDVPCLFAEAEIRAGVRETPDLSSLGL
jgi:aminoglycoside phosphotransferase (APT) family kinase protein